MSSIGTIAAIALGVFLYLVLTPMVNDETCASLAVSTSSVSGDLGRRFMQLIALCWVPWN